MCIRSIWKGEKKKHRSPLDAPGRTCREDAEHVCRTAVKKEGRIMGCATNTPEPRRDFHPKPEEKARSRHILVQCCNHRTIESL